MLAEYFTKKINDALNDKKNFKKGTLIKEDYDINPEFESMMDIHYRGMNFSLEWFNGKTPEDIIVIFACQTVDTVDGFLDVSGYCYDLDEVLHTEDEIDSIIEEIVDMIKSCYIAKNVNTIYKKVEQLIDSVYNLEGDESNKYVLYDILKQYDLI